MKKIFKQNWRFCKIFAFTSEAHITKKISIFFCTKLTDFETLLMYINTQKVIFLKIGIFCTKIITFSSSAHLMKKSTFLPKFQFHLHKIDIFAPKWILTETLYLKVCPKTDAFCIKCYFLLKENNSIKNWHF